MNPIVEFYSISHTCWNFQLIATLYQNQWQHICLLHWCLAYSPLQARVVRRLRKFHPRRRLSDRSLNYTTTATDGDEQIANIADTYTLDDIEATKVSSATTNATKTQNGVPEIQRLTKKKAKVLANRVAKT